MVKIIKSVRNRLLYQNKLKQSVFIFFLLLNVFLYADIDLSIAHYDNGKEISREYIYPGSKSFLKVSILNTSPRTIYIPKDAFAPKKYIIYQLYKKKNDELNLISSTRIESRELSNQTVSLENNSYYYKIINFSDIYPEIEAGKYYLKAVYQYEDFILDSIPDNKCITGVYESKPLLITVKKRTETVRPNLIHHETANSFLRDYNNPIVSNDTNHDFFMDDISFMVDLYSNSLGSEYKAIFAPELPPGKDFDYSIYLKGHNSSVSDYSAAGLGGKIDFLVNSSDGSPESLSFFGYSSYQSLQSPKQETLDLIEQRSERYDSDYALFHEFANIGVAISSTPEKDLWGKYITNYHFGFKNSTFRNTRSSNSFDKSLFFGGFEVPLVADHSINLVIEYIANIAEELDSKYNSYSFGLVFPVYRLTIPRNVIAVTGRLGQLIYNYEGHPRSVLSFGFTLIVN